MRLGLQKLPKAPTFSEGNSASERLPVEDLVLRELRVLNEFDWYVTGGSGAGSIVADPAFRTLRDIEISVQSAGANATLHKTFGHTLGVLERMFQDGTTPQTVPTTDVATTDENDRICTTPIPFDVPWTDFPNRAGLPLALAKPTLALRYFNGAGLVTIAGDATSYDITNGVTELYGRPYYGEDVRGNPKRPFQHWDVVSIRSLVRDITADGEEGISLDHLRPGMDLLDVIVEGLVDGASLESYVYDNDLVEKVGLVVNGVKEFELLDFPRYQDMNAVEFNRSSAETGVVVLSSHVDRDTRPGKVWRVSSGVPRVDLEWAYQASGQNRIVVTTISRIRGIPITAP